MLKYYCTKEYDVQTVNTGFNSTTDPKRQQHLPLSALCTVPAIIAQTQLHPIRTQFSKKYPDPYNNIKCSLKMMPVLPTTGQVDCTIHCTHVTIILAYNPLQQSREHKTETAGCDAALHYATTRLTC